MKTPIKCLSFINKLSAQRQAVSAGYNVLLAKDEDKLDVSDCLKDDPMLFLAINLNEGNLKQLKDKKQSDKPSFMLEIIQLKKFKKSTEPPAKKRKKSKKINNDDLSVAFPWDDENDPKIPIGAGFQPRLRK